MIFFSKYAWFAPSKDKKCLTVTIALYKVLDDSGCELNSTWVDRYSELYGISVKS